MIILFFYRHCYLYRNACDFRMVRGADGRRQAPYDDVDNRRGQVVTHASPDVAANRITLISAIHIDLCSSV